MKTLTTLLTILTLSQFSLKALAYNSQTEASITGAYCECNEQGAFPGKSSLFTVVERATIKVNFENPNIDHRRPINRTNARYKQLNAIGQLEMKDGSFATGFLISPHLIFTNAHVANEGDMVIFHVGQTPKKSSERWADEAQGTVIARGLLGPNGSDGMDWALIKLPDDTLSKKYGYIPYERFSSIEEVKDFNKKGAFLTAGFPGFKDPKYLWGQGGDLGTKSEQVIFIDPDKDFGLIKASSSSGMSGGVLLTEISYGNFVAVGSIRKANTETISMKEKGFIFTSDSTQIINFSTAESGFEENLDKYY